MNEYFILGALVTLAFCLVVRFFPWGKVFGSEATIGADQ